MNQIMRCESIDPARPVWKIGATVPAGEIGDTTGAAARAPLGLAELNRVIVEEQKPECLAARVAVRATASNAARRKHLAGARECRVVR